MYVSIRDCMLSATGIFDPLEAMDHLGLSSIELAVSRDVEVDSLTTDEAQAFALATEEGRAALSSLLEEAGISVCAFLMANDFSSDDIDGEVDSLIAAARAADDLAVPCVRVDLVPRSGEMPEEEFIQRCVAALSRGLQASSGVDFGIENHGGTSNRPQFLDRVLHDVGDDRLGLTLDTGNFYWYGHPLEMVYHLMGKYADRVKHTHVKNIAYPEDIRQQQRETGYRYGDCVCPVYRGDVDHELVVQILEEAGYDRSLCIEDESLGHFSEEEKAVVIEKDVEYLKSIV